MRTKILLVISILLVLFLIIWIFLSPTIKPDDILIEADLKKIDLPESSEHSYYKLEIVLDSKTNNKLHGKYRQYYIYPYINGFHKLLSDIENNNMENENSFVIGTSHQTTKKVLEIIYNNLERFRYPDIKEDAGFYYLGNNYPVKKIFYIDLKDKEVDPNAKFVFFSYYEKKFGRDFSWVKMVNLLKG